jgi:hypothetical protein
MLFHSGNKVVKHCPEGHVMEMAWRLCPKCTGRQQPREAERDLMERTRIFGAPVVQEAVLEAPPDWIAKLTVTSGAAAGREVEIMAGRWKIGRAPRAELGFETVALPEPSMSRDHFVLEAGVAAVILRDLGSTNGTLVNGQRVERHVLREGDIVHAGAAEMRVQLSLRTPS